MIRLGFHLSIAGAVANSAIEAGLNNYTAFQLFTTSARSWKTSVLDADDCKNFITSNKKYRNIPNAHIPYLCNLASSNDEVYAKSKQMLADNINNCNMLGIDCVVIHLGSHLGKGVDYGIGRVCDALNETLESTKSTTILLENGSGYNNCVGSKFSEIGKIMDIVDSSRIGVCFDTCHAFAAGYDIRTAAQVDKLVDEFDTEISLSNLKLVHLNDAKFELGSGLDRHANIGEGNIGRKGFVNFFSNKNFQNGSFVMETPVFDENTHKKDMAAIRSIISDAMKS